MYAAILNKELVLAVSEASLVYKQNKRLNEDIYRCPNCKKRVILVISQKKLPFFKHIKLISGQGEKKEHHESKMLLCAALVALGFPAKVEIPLADQQLRADILVNPNLAFEIQCAPISKQEFNHRHQLYLNQKIKDIWIVGKRHYLTKRLKRSQKLFFRYSKLWGWYYLEVNPFKLKIILKYHVQLEAIRNNLNYSIKEFSLDESGLKALFTFVPEPFTLKQCNYAQQCKYLRKSLTEKAKGVQKIAERMYELNLTIDDLPIELFINYRSPLQERALERYLFEKKQP